MNRLKVYGGRSGEISNQIFPLHKDWRVLREFGQNLDDTRVNYRNATPWWPGAPLLLPALQGDPGVHRRSAPRVIQAMAPAAFSSAIRSAE